jgi:predicted kinase
MSRHQLVIVRGLPGSGKTTFVEKVLRPVQGDLAHFEADMYFVDSETHEYNFVPHQIGQAHNWCKQQCRMAMGHRRSCVVISNTSTQIGLEIDPYLEMAKKHGYEVTVIRLECHFILACKRNTHRVPPVAIKKMEQRFEDYPGEVRYYTD